MKPEFDKEIDALLRSGARGGLRDVSSTARGEARASDRDAAVAPHLDADELAAFAENALPVATRARFVAHLADCDDCRRTATRLALAANVAHARDERETTKANVTEEMSAAERIVATSWRERIAAIFAPRAWRYAMPVVALLCVGVVVLVVMRQVPLNTTQQARRDAAQTNAASSATQAENHATATESAQNAQGLTQPENYNASAPGAGTNAANEVARRAASDSEPQAASQPESNTTRGAATSASGGAAAAGAPSNSAPADVASRRVQDLPPAPSVANNAPAASPVQQSPQSLSTVQPQATPAPANEARAEIAKQAKTKEAANEDERGRQQQRAQSDDDLDSLSVNEQRAANRPALRNAPATSTGATAAAKPAPKREARDDEKKKDADKAADSANSKSSSAETRNVAGRRFRREGDAWIDTAYRSGEATTVVRRGSDQYRALVADEPEIARVANAFGGEVVVVWKGRAYRIKP